VGGKGRENAGETERERRESKRGQLKKNGEMKEKLSRARERRKRGGGGKEAENQSVSYR